MTVDMNRRRREAAVLIDTYFNDRHFRQTDAGSFVTLAHQHKLAAARAEAAGQGDGSLAEEAAMRGMTPGDLAALILDKAAEQEARVRAEELRRQAAKRTVEVAQTPAEVDACLAELGIGPEQYPPA